MPISNKKFYELLAETVKIVGSTNVRVRRYPWTNRNGILHASVKIGENLEHWSWQDKIQQWLRVV